MSYVLPAPIGSKNCGNVFIFVADMPMAAFDHRPGPSELRNEGPLFLYFLLDLDLGVILSDEPPG